MDRVLKDIESATNCGRYWVTNVHLGKEQCSGLKRIDNYSYGYEYVCHNDYGWECDVCPAWIKLSGDEVTSVGSIEVFKLTK